jgi:hypothetical protein
MGDPLQTPCTSAVISDYVVKESKSKDPSSEEIRKHLWQLALMIGPALRRDVRDIAMEGSLYGVRGTVS